MRFCMVTTFYPPYHFGGDAVYVRALARALVARGHEVEVVHCRDAYRLAAPEPKPLPSEDGITVHSLESRARWLSPLITQQTGRPGFKRRRLEQILNANFDVIHYHNISLVGGPGVLSIGRAPVKLYTTHEHWLVCPTHILWKNRQKACDRRECIQCCLRSGVPPQLWRYTSLVRDQFRNVDMMLAPSEFTARQHREAGFDCPMTVLPNFSGLDPGPLPAKKRGVRPRFLYVGRLTASKGVGPMLDAFARLPQYDLDLMGEGDLLESLRQKHRSSGHIRFLGRLPHQDLIARFHAATALVFPSLSPEVCALTLLESLACATPVIARDMESVRELIEATSGGLLYRTDEELTRHLHLLATDDDAVQKLSRNARQGYLNHFTLKQHLETYLSLVDDIRNAESQPAGNRAKASQPREPYQPWAWPLAGHVPQFLHDRLGFLLKCGASGQPVVRLKLDGPVLLLNDPADIKHVLESNYPNYDKTPRLTSDRGRQLSGAGLLTSRGEEHLAKRRALQPSFSPTVLTPLAGVIMGATTQMLGRWRNAQELDIAGEFMMLAHRINGLLLLSEDYTAGGRELGDAILLRRRHMHAIFASLLPFPERHPTSLNREYRKVAPLIENWLIRLIAERRANPGSHRDLLAHLAGARYASGDLMADREIFDEVLTTAITGYETIGEALAWTCYLLAKHPQCELRLVEELDAVLAGRPPEPDDLPRLPYTQKVLSESMRIYPPTWITVRVPREDDVLPSGVRVPSGTRLYICPWVTHRNPKYFPDPERFDPERFEDAARKSRPKYAWFPFGGGPRVCIGQALAKMECALVLAAVYQRFRFELVPGHRVTPAPGITLSPRDDIRARLHRRVAKPAVATSAV